MSETYANTVLVDMDGVLADFDQEVYNRMAVELPEVPIIESRQNFYIADDYPEHYEAVKAISRQPGFFASLPLLEGALEGWQRIAELGYHPQICTSPIRSNPHSRPEKLAWLDQHFTPAFGKSVVDEAIVTSDKHLYHGVALIDDRPELENASMAVWRHIVFDHPYNQGGDQLRLHGWNDEALGEILQQARKACIELGRHALDLTQNQE